MKKLTSTFSVIFPLHRVFLAVHEGLICLLLLHAWTATLSDAIDCRTIRNPQAHDPDQFHTTICPDPYVWPKGNQTFPNITISCDVETSPTLSTGMERMKLLQSFSTDPTSSVSLALAIYETRLDNLNNLGVGYVKNGPQNITFILFQDFMNVLDDKYTYNCEAVANVTRQAIFSPMVKPSIVADPRPVTFILTQNFVPSNKTAIHLSENVELNCTATIAVTNRSGHPIGRFGWIRFDYKAFWNGAALGEFRELLVSQPLGDVSQIQVVNNTLIGCVSHSIHPLSKLADVAHSDAITFRCYTFNLTQWADVVNVTVLGGAPVTQPVVTTTPSQGGGGGDGGGDGGGGGGDDGGGDMNNTLTTPKNVNNTNTNDTDKEEDNASKLARKHLLLVVVAACTSAGIVLLGLLLFCCCRKKSNINRGPGGGPRRSVVYMAPSGSQGRPMSMQMVPGMQHPMAFQQMGGGQPIIIMQPSMSSASLGSEASSAYESDVDSEYSSAYN